MLMRPPWRDLLPTEARQQLPMALIKIMRSDEGDEIRSNMSNDSRSGTPRSSHAGSVSGGPRKPKAKKMVATSRREPSVRKPKDKDMNDSLDYALRLARDIFDSVDTDEDGVLVAEDLEELAYGLWDGMAQDPEAPVIYHSPKAEVKRVMKQYGKSTMENAPTGWKESTQSVATKERLLKGCTDMITFQIFIELLGEEVWQRLLPEEYWEAIRYAKIPEEDARQAALKAQRELEQRKKLLQKRMDKASVEYREMQPFQYVHGERGPWKGNDSNAPRSPKKEPALKTGVQFKRAVPSKPVFHPAGTKRVPKKDKGKDDKPEANTGKALITHGEKLFKEADVDNDGSVDAQELAWCMQKYWEKLGVSSLQATNSKTVQAEANTFIDRFGSHGRLDFVAFLRMLLTKPWRELLTPEAREDLARHIRELANKEDETRAEKNMALLKSLFDDMDRDKNSLLDITEFSTLILATWETFNRSPPNQQALIDRACTRMFDEDDGGFVNFEEYIGILGDDPWNKTLPRQIRDDIKVQRMRLKADGELDGNGQSQTKDTSGSSGGAAGGTGKRKVKLNRPQAPKLWPYNISGVGGMKTYLSPGTATTRARVRVYKNDGGKSRQHGTVLVQSLLQMCEDATKALDMTFSAKRLFTMEGKEFLPFYPEVRPNLFGNPIEWTKHADDFSEIEPGGAGTGMDVQDIIDGQAIICSSGEDFRPREGYATDGMPTKRKSPSKKASKKDPEDELFVASQRANKDRKHLTLNVEKFEEDTFKAKLEKSKSTGDPMIDRIIESMKDFYTKDEEQEPQAIE